MMLTFIGAYLAPQVMRRLVLPKDRASYLRVMSSLLVQQPSLQACLMSCFVSPLITCALNECGWLGLTRAAHFGFVAGTFITRHLYALQAEASLTMHLRTRSGNAPLLCLAVLRCTLSRDGQNVAFGVKLKPMAALQEEEELFAMPTRPLSAGSSSSNSSTRSRTTTSKSLPPSSSGRLFSQMLERRRAEYVRTVAESDNLNDGSTLLPRPRQRPVVRARPLILHAVALEHTPPEVFSPRGLSVKVSSKPCLTPVCAAHPHSFVLIRAYSLLPRSLLCAGCVFF
jgi:hypothetical protein